MRRKLHLLGVGLSLSLVLIQCTGTGANPDADTDDDGQAEILLWDKTGYDGVISILGDIHTGSKPRHTHVPYRESVLTKLLADSLLKHDYNVRYLLRELALSGDDPDAASSFSRIVRGRYKPFAFRL